MNLRFKVSIKLLETGFRKGTSELYLKRYLATERESRSQKHFKDYKIIAMYLTYLTLLSLPFSLN